MKVDISRGFIKSNEGSLPKTPAIPISGAIPVALKGAASIQQTKFRDINPKACGIKMSDINIPGTQGITIEHSKVAIYHAEIEEKTASIDGIILSKVVPKIHGKLISDPSNSNGAQKKYVDPIEFMVQRPLDIEEENSLHKPLWNTQVSGIEFLISEKKALLADDPGLGKTVQATVALRLLFRKGKIRRALIVCPKSTIGDVNAAIEHGDARQWEGHLHLWAPELFVKTILPAVWEGGVPPPNFSGSASMDRKREWMQPAHIYLTTYSLARNDIKNRAFPTDYFDAIVLDEAHAVKNPTSQQSQLLRSMEAAYRWGLTGTPVQNYPSELYGICQFIDPSEFPNLKPKALSELSEGIVSSRASPYVLRREKKQEDLPPKSHQDHWVELTEAQQQEYDAIFAERRARIKQLSDEGRNPRETKTSILGAIQKLKQTCNFDQQNLTSNKVPDLINILNQSLAEDRKIIIFSQYLTRGIEPLTEKLSSYDPLVISGSVNHHERERRFESFKKDPQRQIILLSLMAASEGLNLQEASVVIHFDHWWNPARQWQAEGRAHRFGQRRDVVVHSLRVKETIDQRIYEMLNQKSELIQRVLSGLSAGAAEAEITKAVDLEDLMALFDL